MTLTVRNVPIISIHALLAESDRRSGAVNNTQIDISIHALLAESDLVQIIISGYARDFYPRSPCGERHNRRSQKQRHPHFYPRSPCGERHQLLAGAIVSAIISIHALLAESDMVLRAINSSLVIFLSTLSLRRATCPAGCCTHPADISIHALLAESDIALV